MAKSLDMNRLKRPKYGTETSLCGVAPQVLTRYKTAAELFRIPMGSVPPRKAYEEWFAENSSKVDSRCRTLMTGERLWRVARLIRSGFTQKEASKAVSISPSSVNHWLVKLPPELKP